MFVRNTAKVATPRIFMYLIFPMWLVHHGGVVGFDTPIMHKNYMTLRSTLVFTIEELLLQYSLPIVEDCWTHSCCLDILKGKSFPKSLAMNNNRY